MPTSTAQTSLYALAQISNAAYGTPKTLADWLTANHWVQLPPPDGQALKSSGYVGVAYQNSVTHEIVIANRGTVATSFADLWHDAELTVHRVPPTVPDAINFAKQIARDYPSSTVIETGHSLGGYKAQAALAALVEKGANVVASAVTFQALGLSSDLFHHTFVILGPCSRGCVKLFLQRDVLWRASLMRNIGAFRRC